MATKEGLVAWAKAGLIIKTGTQQGSQYAAVMATGGHGIRLQYNYTHDIAGSGATSPVWLRLTRSGDTITGYESADGNAWKTIGTVQLTNLPATVQWGMFATSPQYTAATSGSFGLNGNQGGPTQATGTFDHLSNADSWSGEKIGGVDNGPRSEFQQSHDGYLVTRLR